MKRKNNFILLMLALLLCFSCDHTKVIEVESLPQGLYVDKNELNEEKALWEASKKDIAKYEFTYQVSIESSIPVEARVYVDNIQGTKEIVIRQRNGFTKDEYLRKGLSEEQWNDTMNQDSAYYYFKSIDEIFDYLNMKFSEYEKAVADKTFYNATCNVQYFVFGIPSHIVFKRQKTESSLTRKQVVTIQITNFNSY